MRKERPALVLSSDALGKLPIKLIAPITAWKAGFERNLWLVSVEPDQSNGLKKRSGVDTLQLRGLDLSRFEKRIGHLSADLLEEVALAVGLVVEVP